MTTQPTPYPVTLYFTKLFTRGTLKGLTHTSSMGFTSVESAAEWLKSARKGHKGLCGTSDYQVVDASFQNYNR